MPNSIDFYKEIFLNVISCSCYSSMIKPTVLQIALYNRLTFITSRLIEFPVNNQAI